MKACGLLGGRAWCQRASSSRVLSCSHAPCSPAIRHPSTPHTTVLTLQSPYLLTLASYYRHPNHRHTISSTTTNNSTSPAATHSAIITCTYPPEKGPRPPLKRLTPQAFHPDASDPTIFVSATSGLAIHHHKAGSVVIATWSSLP